MEYDMATSLVATPQDHVARLQAEIVNLEREIKKLTKGHGIASENRHKHKLYYIHLLRKQELLNKRCRQVLLEELYNAVMSNDNPRKANAEINLAQSSIDIVTTQTEITTSLKNFAEAIKRQKDYEEALKGRRLQMVLKQEEIHRYRPCEKLWCDHCRGEAELIFLQQGAEEEEGYKDVIGLDAGLAREEKKMQFTGMMRRLVSKVKHAQS